MRGSIIAVSLIALITLSISVGLLVTPRETTSLYVFPDGFIGLATILPNQANGVALHGKNGAYTFKFPMNGVLKIKGRNPILNSLDKRTVIFNSGRRIPEVYQAVELQPKKVSFLVIGSYNDGTCKFFVGTSKDWKILKKDLY